MTAEPNPWGTATVRATDETYADWCRVDNRVAALWDQLGRPEVLAAVPAQTRGAWDRMLTERTPEAAALCADSAAALAWTPGGKWDDPAVHAAANTEIAAGSIADMYRVSTPEEVTACADLAADSADALAGSDLADPAWDIDGIEL